MKHPETKNLFSQILQPSGSKVDVVIELCQALGTKEVRWVRDMSLLMEALANH